MNTFEIPEGYVSGTSRKSYSKPRVAHLYKGDFSDLGLPMCRYGWNSDDGESYSIFRNNLGRDGICKICLKRAEAGLDGVESPGPKEQGFEDYGTAANY